MKKILIALLVSLILTGCSANDTNPVEDKDTEKVVEVNEAEVEKENTPDEQMKEVEVPDTGLSLQIPTAWDSSKYKIHKDEYSIMVIYTGEKIQSFFDITVNGKVGSETPDVGLKSEIKTVDDWVMIISYGYELAYAQLDEVRDSNPSDYYKMADSVQKIISSIKIIDEAKLESWFNKRTEKEEVPEQTTFTPVVEEQPEYKKYLDFLGTNDEVSKFIKDDIDLDGKQEIVIAFSENFGLNTFILREDGEVIQEIGKIENGGYGVSNVELINLQGEKKKYIKTGLTNGAGLSGFALYNVDKNTLRPITYCASSTGVGVDQLLDLNEDGYYEGFVQNRFDYYVFNYYISRYYEWDGQNFNLKSTSINLDDYPENPEAVVSQFLKLSILNGSEEKCDELLKRLSELNVSNKKLSFENEYYWVEALQLKYIDVNVIENGDWATVTATSEYEHIEFILTKSNDKWQISDLKCTNAIIN